MKSEEMQLRKQKVLRNVKLRPDQNAGLAEAEEKLHLYLKERHMNQTPERNYILWAVYHLDAPFDVDTLHAIVCEHRARVCRVTIYNSLMLFVEAGVVVRFQPFVDGSMYFEKAFGQKPHGYQVCRRCGAVKIIPLERADTMLTSQLSSTFHLSQLSVYAIGLCRTCHTAERRAVNESKRQWKQKAKLKKEANKNNKNI
ncbi:MAG: transcriptional repressor [Bacteroidales bacterium]|nr:transcriptional repressor [Candidatus Liminaster caballi]